MANRTEVTPLRIDVESASHRYAALIGVGLLGRARELLQAEGVPHIGAIVSSRKVWKLHGRRVSPLVRGRRPVLMADGERAKTLQTVSRIYDGLAERKVERAHAVAAFGGGVVGDVAGFAAATFLRGVPVVQIPTTLLAQVDSAIGGKVGVNLRTGKNLAGAFHSPSAVLIDPAVLRTLPAREFRAGLYEVVKYGAIASRALFDRLTAELDAVRALDMSVLVPLIADCCRIKADIVQADERERDLRRVLNFGHTVGHALEAVTRYRRFLHGEAVGLGMLAAGQVSQARGLMSADEYGALADLIRRLGRLPRVDDVRVADVVEAVTRDKKVRDGRLHFVLCAGIGQTAIASDITARELRDAVQSIVRRP